MLVFTSAGQSQRRGKRNRSAECYDPVKWNYTSGTSVSYSADALKATTVLDTATTVLDCRSH